MLAISNPETSTKHMTCTLNAVLSTIPFSLTKSRRSGEVELVPITFHLKLSESNMVLPKHFSSLESPREKYDIGPYLCHVQFGS